MRTIDVDLPEALLSHRSGVERACRQNRIAYRQVMGYFDADICRILGRQQVTVVDVGANTGLFSMEVLRRTGGRARLYCFEPIPATYRSWPPSRTAWRDPARRRAHASRTTTAILPALTARWWPGTATCCAVR